MPRIADFLGALVGMIPFVMATYLCFLGGFGKGPPSFRVLCLLASAAWLGCGLLVGIAAHLRRVLGNEGPPAGGGALGR